MKRCAVFLLSVFVFLVACGFDSAGQKVYDNADLLTPEQEASLQELCVETAEKSEADFVVVTVDSLDGKTPMQYADDFYDYNGFGYEEEMGSGTLFLISMEDRDYYLSTSGKCVEMLPTNDTDAINEKVVGFLSSGDYYEGFRTYVELTGEYIQNDGKSNAEVMLAWVIKILISLAVAGGAVGVMYSGSSSKITVNGYTYATGHKSEILQQHDVYQRTTTIRREIPTNTGGSGGSHVGSSGNSHGGSGGKF